MTKLIACVLGISSLSLGGCFWATTKSEGEALRKDVTSLQERILSKERALDDQIKKLEQVLDESSKLLRRNSADLGADVQKMDADLREAKGQVATVSNTFNELKLAMDAYRKATDARLDAIEQRVAQIETGKPSANSSPEDLWRLGSAAFEARRFNDSSEIFKRLSSSFPTHERADDALYFQGQSHTNLKDWEKAIGVYQILLSKYPDSALTDDGLYFAALAAQQLKQCTEAKTYAGLIKSKYPRSNVTKQAAELEAQLKKDSRNKSKCTS